MHVTVIINPVSGRRTGPDEARRRGERAMAVLQAHGVEGEVFLTERVGHARELALGAVARGASLVCAWGGDGTVNEVGAALAFTPVALGLVPSGSGNGLARALGVPLVPEAALERALTAPARAIDVGEIGGRLFFNVAGVGFDAHVAHEFGRAGLRRGLRTYLAVVTRHLFTYEALRCRVTCDGESRERRAFLLTAANGPQWGNGALVAPGARFDDGLLDLVTYQPASRLRTLLALPRLFTGSIDRAPGVTIERITTARIEGPAPLPFHVDGEPAVSESGDLLIRVHPGGIGVRA